MNVAAPAALAHEYNNRELVPEHPCLGRIDSYEALLEYQAAKRAHKASLRAAQTA